MCFLKLLLCCLNFRQVNCSTDKDQYSAKTYNLQQSKHNKNENGTHYREELHEQEKDSATAKDIVSSILQGIKNAKELKYILISYLVHNYKNLTKDEKKERILGLLVLVKHIQKLEQIKTKCVINAAICKLRFFIANGEISDEENK